jgi:hypothetical protein
MLFPCVCGGEEFCFNNRQIKVKLKTANRKNRPAIFNLRKKEKVMKKRFFVQLLGVFAALVLICGLSAGVFAQGKGKGNGKGNGNGNSSRGNSNKSKNSDDSLWNGFPNDRNRRGNGNNSSLNKSQRFKGLSKKTGISEDALRARFELERRLNPDLTYGQFVAAHMISRGNRGISTGDILGGLRDGRSIGQILNNRGWDKGKINKERKRIKDIYKDDDDFDDLDDYWGF